MPAAIEFQQAHDWDAVRARCHDLARQCRQRLADRFGLPPISPDSSDWFAQMVVAPLPPCDVASLKTRLYDDHHIEVPLVTWNGSPFIRVSFQGYNDEGDLEALVGALREILL